MSITTKTKKTQKQALLSWLKRHPKTGITSLEAAKKLNIVCVHKRIAELEELFWQEWMPEESPAPMQRIIRTPERTASGSIVTRYKLAR